MTLTVAEIDRWSADAVREVFHAAGARGQANLDVSRQLGSLSVFDTWQGAAAEARQRRNALIRQDLDADGNESLAVARAAAKAADGIERVQSQLRRLGDDAAGLHMTIDALANTIVPSLTLDGPPMAALIAQVQLQPRLDAIVAEANGVDAELAAAINVADGDVLVPPGPHDNRIAIQDALGKPLPEHPGQFHDLWAQLTPEEKDWLYSRRHDIGNHDGMPTVDRDHYNRLALADQLGSARAAAARADALRARHPDWAQGRNIPHPNDPGAIFTDRLDYEAWQGQYDAAVSGTRYLADLQAVDIAVKGKDRRLMLLDTKTGRQTHAAIAVGDPDTATHVSVTTPGLNTTVHAGIGTMADEASRLRDEALRHLRNIGGHQRDTVCAIAWIGYDAPQIPGWDDAGRSLAGAWDISHDALARAGAHHLARFYDGLTAAHHGVPAQLTAIGHSYGSLTTGLALQEPGNHPVSDALFYGSPGIEAATPQQLHLAPGHVYTMETPDDPIRWTYDRRHLIPAIPALGGLLGAGAEAAGTGAFGPNPATNPGFTHLGTGAAAVPDGRGGTLNLQGAHGHSEYPQQGSNQLPRTTAYNIAAVVAGLGDKAVPAG